MKTRNRCSLIVSIVLIVSLSSCSQYKKDNLIDENKNLPSSNFNIVSQSSETSSLEDKEEHFTKILKEDYTGECEWKGENDLTNNQLLLIQSIVDSLNEAHIIYGFKNINDILPTDFPVYLGFRSKYYSDILLDNELNAHLNYDQILTILKGDFGIQEAPVWLEEKQEKMKAPFSSQGNPSEILSIDQDGNIITVVAKMYQAVVRDSSEKESLPIPIQYIFELNRDKIPFIKSGMLIQS